MNKKYSDYSFVKIEDKWYHLQNIAWDSIHNRTLAHKGGGTAETTLDAVYLLTGGRNSKIKQVTDKKADIPANAEGPANPGWLLTYKDHPCTQAQRRAVLRRLIKCGLVMPANPGKGFLRLGLGINSMTDI